jgi:hypothetical protein
MSVYKAHKRVLSRAEYILYISRKWGLTSLGRLLLLFGALGTLLAILGVDFFLLLQPFCWFAVPTAEGALTGYELVWCILALILSLFLAFLGKRAMRSANQMEPVLLLSPRLADQVPAKESLVRACATPELPLKSLQLRAARFEQETAPEQLLRPEDTQQKEERVN